MKGKLDKLGPIEIVFIVLMCAFLASFAEIGILAATNTLASGQMIIAAQMVSSVLLIMLVAAIEILRDVSRK